MPTDTTRNKERIAAHARRIGAFGIDVDGNRHRYDRRRDTVYVTTPTGDINHVEDLTAYDDRDLGDWIVFVAQVVGADDVDGWIDQWADIDDVLEAMQRHEAARQKLARRRQAATDDIEPDDRSARFCNVGIQREQDPERARGQVGD